MAAPDYVPTDPNNRVRTYTSPPLRPGGWSAVRPGEIEGPQPSGPGLGLAGPDQGYALKLAKRFKDRVSLGAVKWDDAEAGCVAVAMKRSAMFGRGPTSNDLTAAFTIFGFLDSSPAADLVGLREERFAEVRSNHHYAERRQLVDLVRDEMLVRNNEAIADQYDADWRRLLCL